VVVDGRVLDGPNGIAGEWGHNPFPGGDDDPARDTCYCGRVGCIETVLCGPALARDHRRATGREWSAERVAEAAVQCDSGADAAIRRYASRLARALSTVVNLLDPDVIVLGGGVSNVDALYRLVPAAFAPHVFSDRIDTRLACNVWGDASGVRGAAWLWPEHP
jgi:predicted NBD/HSP70 family sugar kinase